MKNYILLLLAALFLGTPSSHGQKPAAEFKANRTYLCLGGKTVTFSDSSTNSPTSWDWSFPGGSPNSSTAQKPVVTYSNPGDYNVTLTVTNNSGSDTETKNNYITIDFCKPSKGVYRIPYANGTQVKISNDHLNHAPVNNRIDMVGDDGSNQYSIVAAEDGVIKYIVDNNTDSQGACSNNNYVWIAHPNGEWTKYSHMVTNSTSNAGRFVGEQVCAGTFLGFESDIGCATGPHLHFEVAVPDDLSDPISVSGGFIKGENLIPVICDITNNTFLEGQTYTAGNCSSTSCPDNLIVGMGSFAPPQAVIIPAEFTLSTPFGAGETVFNAGAAGVLRAGEQINLKPGFHAKSGSYLWAAIRACNSSPGLPGCNIQFDQKP